MKFIIEVTSTVAENCYKEKVGSIKEAWKQAWAEHRCLREEDGCVYIWEDRDGQPGAQWLLIRSDGWVYGTPSWLPKGRCYRITPNYPTPPPPDPWSRLYLRRRRLREARV